MTDPIRYKNQTEILVNARMPDTGKDFRFYLQGDKTLVEKLNASGQLEEMIKSDLSKISINPVSGIYSNYLGFNFENSEFLKDFDYANTLVEVHLPYCLHLPNNYELEIDIDGQGKKALIILNKIWTNKAKTEEGKSDMVDIYAENEVIYLKKSSIITPVLPIKSEEGWEQNFTGKNIEKIKEQNGVFRYSKLYIQFDTEINANKLKKGKSKKILEEVNDFALEIVNKLLDVYRFITKQEHIQRLGSIGINMVYFINHEIGFYTLSSGFGIETAPLNRSKKEINEIEKMLKLGEKPSLYNLLVLDAQSSFDNKSYALAVVQSFQALEIFIEDFLLKLLKNRSDTEQQINDYLDKNWKTKTRLKEVLKELKNTTLFESNQQLWNKWCNIYDNTRNEIIHQGKEAKKQEVEETLKTNISVIEWLGTLT